MLRESDIRGGEVRTVVSEGSGVYGVLDGPEARRTQLRRCERKFEDALFVFMMRGDRVLT